MTKEEAEQKLKLTSLKDMGKNLNENIETEVKDNVSKLPIFQKVLVNQTKYAGQKDIKTAETLGENRWKSKEEEDLEKRQNTTNNMLTKKIFEKFNSEDLNREELFLLPEDILIDKLTLEIDVEINNDLENKNFLKKRLPERGDLFKVIHKTLGTNIKKIKELNMYRLMAKSPGFHNTYDVVKGVKGYTFEKADRDIKEEVGKNINPNEMENHYKKTYTDIYDKIKINNPNKIDEQYVNLTEEDLLQDRKEFSCLNFLKYQKNKNNLYDPTNSAQIKEEVNKNHKDFNEKIGKTHKVKYLREKIKDQYLQLLPHLSNEQLEEWWNLMSQIVELEEANNSEAKELFQNVKVLNNEIKNKIKKLIHQTNRIFRQKYNPEEAKKRALDMTNKKINITNTVEKDTLDLFKELGLKEGDHKEYQTEVIKKYEDLLTELKIIFKESEDSSNPHLKALDGNLIRQYTEMKNIKSKNIKIVDPKEFLEILLTKNSKENKECIKGYEKSVENKDEKITKIKQITKNCETLIRTFYSTTYKKQQKQNTKNQKTTDMKVQ